MMFYLGLVVFDHVRHRVWVVRNVFTEGPGSLRSKYRAAVREIAETRRRLETPLDDGRSQALAPRRSIAGELQLQAIRSFSPPSANRKSTFAPAMSSRWSSASASPRERPPIPSIFIAPFAFSILRHTCIF